MQSEKTEQMAVSHKRSVLFGVGAALEIAVVLNANAIIKSAW